MKKKNKNIIIHSQIAAMLDSNIRIMGTVLCLILRGNNVWEFGTQQPNDFSIQ